MLIIDSVRNIAYYNTHSNILLGLEITLAYTGGQNCGNTLHFWQYVLFKLSLPHLFRNALQYSDYHTIASYVSPLSILPYTELHKLRGCQGDGFTCHHHAQMVS